MDEIKKEIKLVHVYVHLALVFEKRWLKPVAAFLAPIVLFSHKLSVDPMYQFKFNLFFTVFWLIQMPFVVWLIYILPHFWAGISFLYLTEASLWANVASHFGALGANLSSIISDQEIENPK